MQAVWLHILALAHCIQCTKLSQPLCFCSAVPSLWNTFSLLYLTNFYVIFKTSQMPLPLDGSLCMTLCLPTIECHEVRWGEVAQSCPILCDPVDCNLLGFSVHGILQARILEWIAISFSRGSSRPRDWTQLSHIGGRRFNLWATREAYSTF